MNETQNVKIQKSCMECDMYNKGNQLLYVDHK